MISVRRRTRASAFQKVAALTIFFFLLSVLLAYADAIPTVIVNNGATTYTTGTPDVSQAMNGQKSCAVTVQAQSGNGQFQLQASNNNVNFVGAGTFSGSNVQDTFLATGALTVPIGAARFVKVHNLTTSGSITWYVTCSDVNAASSGAVSITGQPISTLITNSSAQPIPVPTCVPSAHGYCATEPGTNSNPTPTQVCDAVTLTQCADVSSSGNLSISVNNGNNIAGVDANGNLKTRICSSSGTVCMTLDTGGEFGVHFCDPNTFVCAAVDANGVSANKTCDTTNSLHCAAVDSNGTQAVKLCDNTTNGQCNAINANGALSSTAFKNSSGFPTQPSACDTPLGVNLSATGASQFIAAASGKKNYVCAYNVVAGGTISWEIVEGTGTNCGTGTTVLYGPFPAGTYALGGGLGSIIQNPGTNQETCWDILSGTSPTLQGGVSTTQY